ncbi:MAG: glutamine synthetase [Lachnospiraceae bacterium]|nr:glutamine synthetase [Lachnospiraceae bacterium]MBR4994339.1 glutamine synthetase [Lachnospiraceae bacterium]
MRTKEDIINMIDEEGVEFIRLQFTDIFGRLKNIAVTPGQMEKVFKNKYAFEGSSVFGDMYYYDDNLYLYPILDTFMILPWRPQQGKVAKIVCDVCYEDGTPFELSSRYILKNALKAASEKGYRALVDPECEFFLFHTDENGLPTTQSHEQAGYLDVGPVDFGENARRDIVLMLEEMGFEIESSHHEHAPAQHEVDFKEEEAMRTADNIETFRFAVRSIAKRFGLYATFMPKPKADVAGSGMHTNINIFKNNRSIFRNEDGSATDDAYYFIGGILKHAKALCAIANPIVNSYKRLILGTDEINKITWAEKGEKSLVKLLKTMDEIKVELRFPDGASNPYLLLATCIAAGVDGIENKINPGKDINSAGKDAVFENLPENLRDAIDELNKDELIKGVLGEEFVNIYSKIKIDEWKDYMKEVSDWEINTYLTRM